MIGKAREHHLIEASLEQPRGGPGGPVEQRFSARWIRDKPQRLEELERDAEGELALERAAVCPEDLHSPLAREVSGDRQQAGFALARRRLDHDDCAVALAGIGQPLVEHGEFPLALHERGLEPGPSCTSSRVCPCRQTSSCSV